MIKKKGFFSKSILCEYMGLKRGVLLSSLPVTANLSGRTLLLTESDMIHFIQTQKSNTEGIILFI